MVAGRFGVADIGGSDFRSAEGLGLSSMRGDIQIGILSCWELRSRI